MIYLYVDNGYQVGQTYIHIYLVFVDSMCSVDKNMRCSGTDGHVMSRYLQVTGSKTFMQYTTNIGISD